MDAIILAGAGKTSRLIFGENKAFLLIKDRPLVEWVLEAVLNAQGIERIAVVGPKEPLNQTLGKYLSAGVILVEQGKSLYENAFRAIYQVLGIKDESELNPEQKKKSVLALSADIPLLVSEEIEYFLKKADLSRYDFIYGVCSEDTLKKFSSQPEKPGIDLACFHTDQFSGRICNLVLAKPFQFKNRTLLDQTYSLRYQKNPFNIIKTILKMLALLQPGLLWNYLWLQLGLQAEKSGRKNFAHWTGKRVKLEKVLKQISLLLGLRFGILETPFGGSALDADNERDFLILAQRFDEWKNQQKKIGAELKEKGII